MDPRSSGSGTSTFSPTQASPGATCQRAPEGAQHALERAQPLAPGPAQHALERAQHSPGNAQQHALERAQPTRSRATCATRPVSRCLVSLDRSFAHEDCPRTSHVHSSPLPHGPGLERRRRWSHERARERSRRATGLRLARWLCRGLERWRDECAYARGGTSGGGATWVAAFATTPAARPLALGPVSRPRFATMEACKGDDWQRQVRRSPSPPPAAGGSFAIEVPTAAEKTFARCLPDEAPLISAAATYPGRRAGSARSDSTRVGWRATSPTTAARSPAQR